MNISFQRIFTIIKLTLREAVRRRLIYFLLLSGVLFIAAGTGCVSACQNLQSNAISMTQDDAGNTPAIDTRQSEQNGGEIVINSILSAFLFSMIAICLYATSALFTPFLAMNDFQTGNHITLLSRPLRRSEYLTGKFTAIIALLLMALSILLLSSFGAIYLFRGSTDWNLLRGVPALFSGILTFTAMLFFLSLFLDRILAPVFSILILSLSAIPGISLISGKEDAITDLGSQIAFYSMAYGLPGYALNFFYALDIVLKNSPIHVIKVGVNSGLYATFVNLVWFLVFYSLSLLIFQKKKLNA